MFEGAQEDDVGMSEKDGSDDGRIDNDGPDEDSLNIVGAGEAVGTPYTLTIEFENIGDGAILQLVVSRVSKNNRGITKKWE